MSEQEKNQAVASVSGGCGPLFPCTDMPESQWGKMTWKQTFKMMGPAVIALGGSIGGGEWLVGPALFVKYGLILLWITTISTTLQTFLNLEMVRYTLVTGEPITIGFMRLKPGKQFWGWLFTVAGFVERAMPGWALACATAVAAMQLGRIPGLEDKPLVIFWGYFIFIGLGILLAVGGRVEKILEIVHWLMCATILVGLLIIDLFVAPATLWWDALTGYVSFGKIPPGIDILLFGALVGYSAYGGFGNNCLTNWYRDKGYGMAARIGYIASAIGGKEIHVTPSGMMPPPTKENVEHFKGWWKLLNFDQWAIFWVGGLLGMALPGILYVSQIAPGTKLASWGIAVAAAEHFGTLGFYMIAAMGFWILFSSAMSNIDLVPRQCTDMLWYSSETVRKWAKNDIRKVYYGLLVAVIIWGTIYVNITLPLIILAISANVANFTMALSAILTVRVNRKFLAPEYRPQVWRELILIFSFLFFGLFFTIFILTQFLGIKM
ncbi:MAG: Nramp family divalent metal transporter [Deltaproteobacteria bacterium]|nr:Nramp family divalent metal transporter [Deltaproteobacteria bacterium]